MRASDVRLSGTNAGRHPTGQAPDRGGGHEIAGGVVERLHRQRLRAVGAEAAHAFGSDAGAHLDQTVEPTPAAPRTGPAIGIQRDIHQARREPPPRLGIQPEPRKRAWPIAVNENVGLGDEVGESLAILGKAQVEPGATLAQRHVGDDRRFVPPGRVDAQHVGAEPGEEARRHGTGQHPGQVEDADAGERPLARSRQISARQGIRGLDPQQGLGGHAPPLRMIGPGGERAHRRRAPALLDHRRLEIIRCPARDRGSDGGLLVRRAENRERRVPMMGRIGMEPDPAVLGRIIAGDRIPDRRQRPALRLERPRKPERGEPPVGQHLGQIAEAGRHQLGRRQAGGGDRSDGKVTYGEGRGHVAGASLTDRGQIRLVPAECRPDRPEKILGRRRVHQVTPHP